MGERDEEVFYLKERIAKWEEFGRRVKERELRIPKQKEGGMNPALIIIDDKMEEPDERE